jgi:hypothetical protein
MMFDRIRQQLQNYKDKVDEYMTFFNERNIDSLSLDDEEENWSTNLNTDDVLIIITLLRGLNVLIVDSNSYSFTSILGDIDGFFASIESCDAEDFLNHLQIFSEKT